MISRYARWIFLAASLCLPVLASEPSMHSYTRLDDGASTISLFGGGATVAIGDVASAPEDCSTAEAYCIRSEGFILAIPYGKRATVPGGLALVELSRFRSEFLGVNAEVRVVDLQAESARFRYWYSDRSGLLAFAIVMEGKEVTYLLRGTSGFLIPRTVGEKAKS
jgi:hypothetical protein